MKSSTRLWAAAAVLLLLSVSLKLALVHPAAKVAEPELRLATLHRFLTAASVGGVEGVPSGPASPAPAGWRFRLGACDAALFPSEKRGALDSFVRSHRRRSDRIAYVYRGEVRSAPPTWALALDVILYKVTSVFRPSGEPGYAVLIYSQHCDGPPKLPWTQLPAI